MKLIQTRQPREPIRVHFTTGPEETREAMRAALYFWIKDPRPSRKGQWSFGGQALRSGVQVGTSWQHRPGAQEFLRGNVVPAQDGGSDFVGEVLLPRSVWLARFLILPLLAAVYIATVATIIALLTGHHGFADRLLPFAELPIIVPFAIGWIMWDQRQERNGRGTPTEALKNWVTSLPGSSTS